MKKLLTLVSVLTWFFSFAQDGAVDSLKHLLEEHPKSDTARFRLLITTSDYLISDPEKSKAYLEEAFALALELEFSAGVAEAYCSLAYYFADRMDYVEAVDNGLNALREYEKINSRKGLFEANNALAGIYTSWGDFGKAIEYMENMMSLVKQNPDLVDEAELFYNLARSARAPWP